MAVEINYPKALMQHVMNICNVNDAQMNDNHNHNVVVAKILYVVYSNEPRNVIMSKLHIKRSSFYYYKQLYDSWRQYDPKFKKIIAEVNEYAKSCLK